MLEKKRCKRQYGDVPRFSPTHLVLVLVLPTDGIGLGELVIGLVHNNTDTLHGEKGDDDVDGVKLKGNWRRKGKGNSGSE